MCFDGRWAATDATWRGNSNFWNGQTSGQLVYDLGAGVTKTARRYKIQCGYGVGSYNPTAWTFEGSNTGAFAGEQTTLDTQTGISWTDKEIKTFSFANSTAYRYYRFNYSAVDGASSCIIYEMEIYEMVPKGATSLTIPSLTGNSDVLYRLRARVVNGYNGTSIVGVRPNGDTAGNYGYQNLRGISTGVDASGGAVIDLVDFCVCTALNNISSAEMILYAKSGYVRTAIHETVLDVNGTGVLGISLYGHSYTDTATEITTLVIYASQANGLGIGSSFSLERLNL